MHAIYAYYLFKMYLSHLINFVCGNSSSFMHVNHFIVLQYSEVNK